LLEKVAGIKGGSMKANVKTVAAEDPEARLAGFIEKFEPSIAALIRSARTALRKRMPAANELVYDNYNFFVIGYCSTERPSDCIASLVANAKGIGLSFYYGSTLPDPAGILEGSGTQNRFLRLAGAADLAQPAVEALIAAAIHQARSPLPAKGKGRLIIRSVSEKQRPRRLPVKSARKK